MMEKLTALTSVAAPLLRANIDTDIVIPISRMVGNSTRGSLGQWCFSPLRYQPDGSENPEFILNRAPYRSAQILITGVNFGCGSSREAAVWALKEMGVRCLIGSSFGDIFFNNCFQNGVLPVVLDRATVESLAREVEASQGAGRISVDLNELTVTAPSGTRHRFAVEPKRRQALLEGLDEIAVTLQRAAEITAFQTEDRRRRPWVYSR
ncbi:MAG TPA: 3-isopropylmalate dehydratase small subunit [Hyphomicrobiaceae bacterium]|jgi:3-isopropylmalate/(R)-2-methylmalate dehydratase small subunit|nr:3-isopropylmalate dehydratase small subunit [Hyphomicrobiaceae bacterium]